ncbi:MAG: DivIVA domain-containing protein [Oscillospiraceae bacterium]|nr:DivIVA domain-containing protein [Oscillospiraceae bacterium]
MNAKEIVTKRFEKAAFNGYKTDDVDDYLKEVSDEFAQLQKEKDELERKLEVLADKIREYRDDEDALRDALLVAQKQGNAIVAESKASAEKLTKETNDTVTKQLADAKTKSERLVNDADEYSKKTRADADATAAKIISDANNKAAEIKAAMDRQQEIQENILQQTRKEVLEYRTKILAGYKEHIALIESLPEKCENDYIKKTAEEVEKREAERAEKAKQAAAKAAQQKAKPAPPKPAPKPAPAPAKPADNKPDDKAAKSADKAKEAKSEKASEKTSESNLPFFKSPDETTRHDNLKFGKNNK